MKIIALALLLALQTHSLSAARPQAGAKHLDIRTLSTRADRVSGGDALVAIAVLAPLLPVFVSYVLSFLYVGIYWNNHHHLFHAVGHVNGAILWANLHLLFWLSLFPFVTRWVGENHFPPVGHQPDNRHGNIKPAGQPRTPAGERYRHDVDRH